MIAAAGPRLGEIRVRYVGWLAAGLAGLAVAVLIYLGRHLNFVGDEWTFIFIRRGFSPDVFFAPHNEHWSTLPVIIYKALFSTVGLRSYIPYLAMLELLHVGAAVVLFALLRRRAGDALALAGMALFLFLGRGGENILWAFQIGFVGSVFCGLLATWLLEPAPVTRGRMTGASLALLASLMFSGVGLFFCAAVGADLVLDRDRRPALWVLALPAAAYLVWFVTFGAAGASAHRSPLSVEALRSLVTYVPAGIGAAVAGLAGLSSTWASLALALGAALLTLRWYQRGRIDSRMVGALVGLLAQFDLTGLVRGQLGEGQAASGRYVYVAAAFLIPVLVDAARDLEWRGMLGAGLAAVFVLALGHSALVLRTYAHDRTGLILYEDAELQTLSAFRGAPSMHVDTLVDPALPPVTPGPYFAAVDALGSPVPRIDVAGVRRLPAAAAVDQAMAAVFGGSLSVRAGGATGQTCLSYDAGSTAYADVLAPSAGSVTISSSVSGLASLWLSFEGPPAGNPVQKIVVTPQGITVGLPDAGQPIDWRLRVGMPAAGQLSVCGALPA